MAIPTAPKSKSCNHNGGKERRETADSDNWPSIDSLRRQVKPQKGDADSERCIKSSLHIHGKLTGEEEGGGGGGGRYRAGAGMTAVSTTGEEPRKESVQQEAPQTRVQVLNDS